MRTLPFTLVVFLAVAGAALAAEDDAMSQRAADLAPPVHIIAGGRPLEVGGFAAPCVGDFDGDGKCDLLVGQYTLGRLRIYRNEGTPTQPRFATSQWFHADGRFAGVPHCCLAAFTPQLVDFDGDGRTDILTGSGIGGEVFLFRRNADGNFAGPEVLQNREGQVLMHRFSARGQETPRQYNVTALAYDWDDDGDLDLVLGRSPLCLVLNLGSNQSPQFDGGRLITCDGQPILAGIGAPQLADWDGDGLDDLIAGSQHDIVWYRNIGQRGKPQWATPELLVLQNEPLSLTDVPRDGPGRHHAFCVADFNSDGKLDLLVGDRFRRTALEHEAAEPLTESQEQRFAELRDAYSRARRDEPSDETRAERVERYRALLRTWQEYERMRLAESAARNHHIERRGFVWLFQRTQ